MKRRTRALVFIFGFLVFSFSSVLLLSNYPKIDYLIFIAGVVSLFLAELSLKSRMNLERVIGTIILIILGIALLYISANAFEKLIMANYYNEILGIMYFAGWAMMFYSGKILKLSKIL